MKSDLGRYVDLQFLAVTTLVRNKEKLVKLMRGVSDDAMAFVRRSGIYFGLCIGLVQMIAWALFKNPWIMPAFGFAVGFVSDYIALNMLFRPVQPKKYLGFIPFRGCCTPSAKRSRGTTPRSWPTICSRRRSSSTACSRARVRTSCSRWSPRRSRRPSMRRRVSRVRSS